MLVQMFASGGRHIGNPIKISWGRERGRWDQGAGALGGVGE